MSIKILGIAQDGGVPQFACDCNNCEQFEYRVTSIAIISDKTMLVDATPDITSQVRMLGSQIDSILITHLHIGHYIGLLQLGKEVASTSNFPVYTTPKVARFLRENKPFSYLVKRGQIKFIVMEVDNAITLGDLKIIPFEVPHRNEDGNTIGLEIQGAKKAIYIPDIDYLSQEIIEKIQSADLVFLDATFYSKSEINRQENVPHPAIDEIMHIFGKPTNQFNLIHLNHSNPALNPGSEEFQEVLNSGYHIAEEGRKYILDGK